LNTLALILIYSGHLLFCPWHCPSVGHGITSAAQSIRSHDRAADAGVSRHDVDVYR
jgi:hypothetical protein